MIYTSKAYFLKSRQAMFDDIFTIFHNNKLEEIMDVMNKMPRVYNLPWKLKTIENFHLQIWKLLEGKKWLSIYK